MVRRFLDDERGIEVIEFVGLLPLVFLAALITYQLILVGHTSVVAAGAAREGARAAAVGASIQSAVDRASPGFDVEVVGYPAPHAAHQRVVVEAQIPRIPLPFDIHKRIDYPSVRAEATMRKEF